MTTVQEPLAGPFSPPPCSAAHIDPLLNEDYAKALTPAPEPPRCRFLSSDKRQCRMLRADHHPDFCLFHAARQDEILALLPEREFALAPELEALAADLTTATGVNRALGQVFRLLAQIASRARTLSPSAISPNFCSKPFPASAPKPFPPSAIRPGPHNCSQPSLRNPSRLLPPPLPPLTPPLRLRLYIVILRSPRRPKDPSVADRSPRNRRREIPTPQLPPIAQPQTQPAALSPSRIMPIS